MKSDPSGGEALPSPVPETKKKRGRPSSGISRKEQLRMATFRHRLKSQRELLQVELNTGIAYFIRRQMEAGYGASKREVVERLLMAGIQQEIGRGETYLGPVAEGFAEGLIAEWLKTE